MNALNKNKEGLRIDQFIKENRQNDKSKETFDSYEYDREFDQNMDQTDKQMQFLQKRMTSLDKQKRMQGEQQKQQQNEMLWTLFDQDYQHRGSHPQPKPNLPSIIRDQNINMNRK